MKDKIKVLTDEFLQRLGFPNTTTAVIQKEGGYYINIMSSEGRLLIGKSGAHLVALEKILHIILKHQTGTVEHLDIDINSYKESHDRYLRTLALEAAKKSLVTNQPVALPAMPAKDRHFIHSELSIRPDVVTESRGEDPERFIVVHPRP